MGQSPALLDARGRRALRGRGRSDREHQAQRSMTDRARRRSLGSPRGHAFPGAVGHSSRVVRKHETAACRQDSSALLVML
jgi:hypothetical protein